MKNSVVIVTAAVAGLAAGLAGAFLVPREAPATQDPRALVPEVRPVDRAELTTQLDALRAEIEDLHLRLAWLEDAAVDPRQPVEAREESLTRATAEQLSELASLLESPDRELPEPFQQSVQRVLEDVRQAEQAERDERRAEAIAERTEEQLSELVSELGLTPVQTDQMRDHLASVSEKRSELFENARDNGDFMGVRDSMRELRRESEDALSLILDPAQLERYRELDRDDRGGRGRGRDDGSGEGSGRRGGRSE